MGEDGGDESAGSPGTGEADRSPSHSEPLSVDVEVDSEGRLPAGTHDWGIDVTVSVDGEPCRVAAPRESEESVRAAREWSERLENGGKNAVVAPFYASEEGISNARELAEVLTHIDEVRRNTSALTTEEGPDSVRMEIAGGPPDWLEGVMRPADDMGIQQVPEGITGMEPDADATAGLIGALGMTDESPRTTEDTRTGLGIPGGDADPNETKATRTGLGIPGGDADPNETETLLTGLGIPGERRPDDSATDRDAAGESSPDEDEETSESESEDGEAPDADRGIY